MLSDVEVVISKSMAKILLGKSSVLTQRGLIAADYACHVFTPLALEARGRIDKARRLREAARITNRDTALQAQGVVLAVGCQKPAEVAHMAYVAANITSGKNEEDGTSYARAAIETCLDVARAAMSAHVGESVVLSELEKMFSSMLSRQ